VNYLKEKGDSITESECEIFFFLRWNAWLGKTKKWVIDNCTVHSLAKQIGQAVGKLHGLNIVHGDLTTSNMILKEGKDLVMIDYGLSGMSSSVEDKAVDLYVLSRAISSTHPHLTTLVRIFFWIVYWRETMD
jgi:Kae1-associated kinase Bud32